jgi:hypothetical protein
MILGLFESRQSGEANCLEKLGQLCKFSFKISSTLPENVYFLI